MSKSIIEKIKARAAEYKNSGEELPYSWEDLQAIRREAEIKHAKYLDEINRKQRQDLVFGRSGIMPIHQKCSVVNFIADTEDKIIAQNFATNYIANFDNCNGRGFVFSGTTGTGKNHLAAAICNALIAHGRTGMIITVNELMQRLRACYGKDSKTSESAFFDSLINLDILVIDEVGLQRQNDNERLALNHIIDQRVGNLRPTGILTNLDAESDDARDTTMTSVLGVRIMDRLRANNGAWITFNWESYR